MAKLKAVRVEFRGPTVGQSNRRVSRLVVGAPGIASDRGVESIELDTTAQGVWMLDSEAVLRFYPLGQVESVQLAEEKSNAKQ